MKRKKHSKPEASNGNGHYGWLFKKPPKPVILSRKEIVKKIEKGARELRGIGAHELLSSYRKHTLRNPGEVTHLLILSGLLRDDDPIFA